MDNGLDNRENDLASELMNVFRSEMAAALSAGLHGQIVLGVLGWAMQERLELLPAHQRETSRDIICATLQALEFSPLDENEERDRNQFRQLAANYLNKGGPAMNMIQPIDTYPRNAAEEFPLTLEACRKGDASLWEIGDALIAECGAPGKTGNSDGSTDKIKAAAKYLVTNGLDFVLGYLRNIRTTAFAFSSTERHENISFNAHAVACNPETLSKVIDANPGGTITVAMVHDFRAHPQVKAERAAAKRMVRAKKVQVRGRTGNRCPSFEGLPRGTEIAVLPATGGTGRAMITKLAKEGRGGKEIWSLILQAKDAGFVTRVAEPSSPTIRCISRDSI